MRGIFRGYVISAVISAVLTLALGYYYLEVYQGGQLVGGWWRTPVAVLAGLILATALDRLTNYFTGTQYSPVQEIRNAADTPSAFSLALPPIPPPRWSSCSMAWP